MHRPILISDIKQFIGHVSTDLAGNNINIFRGQQNKTWDLKASVFRDKYDDNKEKKIYETIKKYNFDEFSKRELFFDELIQMQHFGIPTRLFDWSYNPLIALYFTVAYEDSNDGYVFQNTINKSEIYSFNSANFKNLSQLFQTDSELDVLSFEYDADIRRILKDAILNSKNTYFIDSVLRNNRIRAQQGCFSITIDKKKKFIEYILSDIFLDILRNFYSSVSINDQIKELIELNLKNNTEFKDIISKSMNVYRSKGDSIEYERAFKDYINSIKFNNVEFCRIENITNLDVELDFTAKEFTNFVISEISKLEINQYELKSDDLRRYKINKKDKSIIKRQLENIGITSTFVYPDIQGTIEHIRNIFK